MKEDKQVVVNAKGDKVLIGSDFHILETNTEKTFKTSNMAHFIKYLQDRGKDETIYYSLNRCISFTGTDYNRKTKPTAECSLTLSSIYNYLQNINGQKMDLIMFEKFLKTVKPYMTGSESLKLLDFVNNFQITKTKTIKKSKDNRGNFKHCFATEAGKDDYVFPEKIKVRIPVFADNTDCDYDFEFDFFFSYKEYDGEYSLYFEIQDIEFSEKVEHEQIAFISNMLNDAKLIAFFGNMEIITTDDAWKYKENSVE